MKTRNIFKLLSILFIIISCANFSDKKPNIIVFIADDVSWDDIGCYGNNDVVTPNIDALAKNGLIFKKLPMRTVKD